MGPSFFHLRATYAKLVVVLMTRIDSLQSGYDDAGGDHTYESAYAETLELATTKELDEWLQERVEEAIRLQEQTGLHKYNPIIRRAMREAWQRCGTGVTLQSVAAAVEVSPNYLGQLFKQQVGKNFVSWLNSFRMQRAQKYLKDPRFRIYEVGEKVGIHDSSYFHQLFKATTGCSPTEYRKRYGL
jgi:two-component system response regulator YesN